MIKKLLTLTVLVCFAQFLTGQSTYQKVTVVANSQEIMQLVNAGFNFDHAKVRKGHSITGILKSTKVDQLQQMGFDVKIEISDVSTFYAERAKNDPLYNFQLKNANCIQGSGSVNTNDKYTIPENFSLGSYAGYFTYQEFLDNLDSMASKYPNLITVKQPINTFQTHQGRPIYWVKISDNPNTDEPEPETLYSAIHHAREPASLSQLIFYMWHMLENYNTDDEVQYLVNETEMYFVPVLNPDGYIINETYDPNGGGMWRKNARDNDNSSTLNGQDGVDLNRNYDYQFGVSGVSSNPADDTYPGPNGFSEPETQAMKWFCEQHEFKFALNAHTYGDLLLHPFGYATNDFAADHNYFQAITHHMVKENNYVAQKSSDLYPAAGDSDDWMYDGDLGSKPKVYAMTPEIGNDNDGFYPQPSRIIPICKDNVFQNKRNAHLLKNYATIKENGGNRLETSSGYIKYTIQRLGLESGNFDVSLTPLTGFDAVGSTNTHTGMNIMDIEEDSISYTLSSSLSIGDPVKFILHLDNGLWVHRDTIEKIYGVPGNAYSDAIDNLSNWNTTGTWDLTPYEYYSADYAITDSPNSNYFNNVISSVTNTSTFDLTNATQAIVRFQAKWEIENNYDYVQFEVSTNNGGSWIPQCGLYTNPGSSNQDQDAPVYDGFQTDWVQEEIDLSDYLGQEIMFRFQFVSDSYVMEDGFYFDDFKVYINDINSINENKLSKIRLYPNPAQQSVQITTDKDYISNIKVLDRSGKLLQHQVDLNQKNIRLNIDGYASGIYLVEITTQSGLQTVEKLVINQ